MAVSLFVLVGMTGFEPATTRPPAVCATGLRHIPKLDCKNIKVVVINFYVFWKSLN